LRFAYSFWKTAELASARTIGRPWTAWALAEAYEFGWQLDKNGRLLNELLEKRRSIYGAMHPSVIALMRRIAWNYALMDRLQESLALFEEYFELRKEKDVDAVKYRSSLDVEYYAFVCQWAKRFDLVDGPLRYQLAQLRSKKGGVQEQGNLANILGFLAMNLLLQERYDEAEPFAREAVALNAIEDRKYHYWVSGLGAILLGQGKYPEAEPLLLRGYEGIKRTADGHPVIERRLTEVTGWLVRLYEVTNQPEKARAWREKAKAVLSDAASGSIK
jgi:tetratricopeptide (TPR) repeat protein